MGFSPISIDKYVEKHLKSNPAENEKNLREQLQSALTDHLKGVKCSCGNDIWVIGSAFAGNSCFTCITGESYPTDDYEIDRALERAEKRKGRRHIDEMDPAHIAGFFDDDGFEINTDLIKKPSLCITCLSNIHPDEEILCHMTRFDQRDTKEFECFAYKKI